jgi:chloramphenicol-sensitive protein RarD
MNKGVLYAIGAYLTWGLLPVYWKLLHDVPATQLLGHRILWSFVMLVVILIVSRQVGPLRAALRQRRILLVYLGASLLIGVNWFTYVWAVNAGFMVETSLGYYINPLLSVLLGVVFLRERLRPWQWGSIGLAAAGVIYLTLSYGALPWIALTLAVSFGLYALIKKMAPLGSLHGLMLETGMLLLPALVYLLSIESAGEGAFLRGPLTLKFLLAGAGVATTLPLLMFATAARRIPLGIIGILQYITPTMQFLLGVLVYEEPLPADRLVGFVLVWIALVMFLVEGMVVRRSAGEAGGGGYRENVG